MMEAGRMRHRVSIERPTKTQSANGEEIRTWPPAGGSTVVTCWALVEPVSGREMIRATQPVGTLTHRVTIRYWPGVLVTDRVKFGSRILEINAAINREERNIELELLCTEVTQ